MNKFKHLKGIKCLGCIETSLTDTSPQKSFFNNGVQNGTVKPVYNDHL